MSLVSSKLGRFALGLVASSGAALFIGGTALADSVVSDTSSPTPNAVTKDISSTTETVQAQTSTLLSVTGSNGSSGSSANTLGSPVDSAVVTAQPTDQSTNSPAIIAPIVAKPTDSDDRTVVAPSGNVEAASVSEPAASDTTPAPPAISQSVLHRADLSANVISMPSTPVQEAAPVSASASTNSHQPTPPQSSGTFTMLATTLAGVVVPQLFQTFDGLVSLPARITGLALLTLTSILLSLLVQTYGQRLRRSGFATAARSDVSSLTFATPSYLDYGQLRLPIAFFSGVRDQNYASLRLITAYQKGGE